MHRGNIIATCQQKWFIYCMHTDTLSHQKHCNDSVWHELYKGACKKIFLMKPGIIVLLDHSLTFLSSSSAPPPPSDDILVAS